MPSAERLVAFLTDSDLAERKTLLSAEGFRRSAATTPHIRQILESQGYEIVGEPRNADASSSRLDVFFGNGWLATGDAAIAFDPLSSQGVFNALYTGVQAAVALDAALAGDREGLGRYAGRLEEIHAAYRRNQATFYAMERRWRDRPFWRRRLPA